MDSLSSSFLSAVPHQNLLPLSKTPLPPINLLTNISSIRREEKTKFSTSPIIRSASTLPTQPPRSVAKPYTAPPTPKTTALLSKFFSAWEDIITKFIDPPDRPWVNPGFVFSGNFAPVDELPPTECPIIEGTLPSCLDGAYIRNGPNHQFLPRGPSHLFDGDGMLHCLRISGGRATFCSRYVKTYKYIIERKAGTKVIPNYFSDFHGLAATVARGVLWTARMIAYRFDQRNGIGVANTSVARFGDRLYAMCESDLPYEIRVTPHGDVETVGRYDFDGKHSISMTAHPKVDPDTGEVFAFRNRIITQLLTYFRLDADGNKQCDVPIFSMHRPFLLHDFAITKKYAIFPDIQFGMDLLGFFAKGEAPAAYIPSKVPRLGVIPRYATDNKKMRWFEVPGFNMYHAINAWDEEDDNGDECIILVAPNVSPIEHMIGRMELLQASMEKVKINLNTGKLTRHPLSPRNLELSVINPAYLGKKNKYVYAGMCDRVPTTTGVVKLDVSTAAEGGQVECTVACRMYGPRCYGGEPFFVARDPDNPNADEDDGYLVSYVHDEEREESKFIVMDAQSPTLDVVASVTLPQRVPYGFHGLFVRNKDLITL
ncbi:hypothetical protein Nepgr_024343 [Nepenthes gracilis]|uniref:Carotenoid cleavage dioxygenase n=1 Tax=Nepenthes gracilis TaxID=150966 RepID=A0AAD3XZZ2_NEPGR|nr:hypothetical protein Nepgr_024343 [Nepenthes gracilis]